MVTGMGGNHEKNRSAMDNEGFYTMKGYERANVDELTSSMEDYLEMVCPHGSGGISGAGKPSGRQPACAPFLRIQDVG